MSEDYTIGEFQKDILHLCLRADNSSIEPETIVKVLSLFAAETAAETGMSREQFISAVELCAERVDWQEKFGNVHEHVPTLDRY